MPRAQSVKLVLWLLPSVTVWNVPRCPDGGFDTTGNNCQPVDAGTNDAGTKDAGTGDAGSDGGLGGDH